MTGQEVQKEDNEALVKHDEPLSQKITKKNKRTVPMEVLVLGMCRTGTQSIADALEVLGYPPIYHMREVKKSAHENYWVAAFESKFDGSGDMYDRDDWDDFLGDYAGISDVPAVVFAEELIEAYPEAKLILTTRDEDRWFTSMEQTIWKAPPTETSSPVGFKVLNCVWGGLEEPGRDGRAKFRAHNDLIRRLAGAQGRDLLEYEVAMGWDPLCRFLGKELPDAAFPRQDDWAAFKAHEETFGTSVMI